MHASRCQCLTGTARAASQKPGRGCRPLHETILGANSGAITCQTLVKHDETHTVPELGQRMTPQSFYSQQNKNQATLNLIQMLAKYKQVHLLFLKFIHPMGGASTMQFFMAVYKSRYTLLLPALTHLHRKTYRFIVNLHNSFFNIILCLELKASIQPPITASRKNDFD